MRLVFLFSLVTTIGFAQPWIKKVDSVKVFESSVRLPNPWAGGLNFCQFSEIDLDQDGTKDLFVFDRTGNKITTFINKGTAGVTDYVHAPEYQDKFPQLHDWALLADYNCDGKADIFTYYSAGFSVYKNISTLSGGLQFTLVKQQVRSVQYSMNLNLYVSPVDIPAIVDVDNDGDLDILTFHIGGTLVEYHKNLSKESYGICDSLKFEMKNQCFGYFYENSMNNSVTLDDTCSPNVLGAESTGKPPQVEPQHSGSTIFAFDKDGDGDKELVLGDIAYKNMVLLTNGGTITANKMVAQDPSFPSNTTPVNLSMFPAAFFLDVNNDGKKDLLVSPNAANVSENYTSVWHYSNTGTTNAPVFNYQQNNFLQRDMIETGEGNYPVFFDYNKDGKQDLVIGNHGYFLSSGGYESKLLLYENTGTPANPEFTLITRDYSGLSGLGLNGVAPTFGDLDGDGDKDLVIGDVTGKVHYLTDTSTGTNPASFVLAQINLGNIDVGQASTPQLIDVNRDGKLDLLIGEQGGNINYHENTGTTTTPTFTSTPTSATFGGVKVNKVPFITGFSAPFMFDVSGNYKLLVGSENGYLYMYDSIDGNLTGNFKLLDSMYLDIYEGNRTAPYGADINNDSYLDVVIGNYSGGTSLYLGRQSLYSVKEEKKLIPEFVVYPNPSSSFISIEIKTELPEKYYISVENMVGQKVMNEEAIKAKTTTLNVNNLNAGIYFIKLSDGRNNSVKRLIVTK